MYTTDTRRQQHKDYIDQKATTNTWTYIFVLTSFQTQTILVTLLLTNSNDWSFLIMYRQVSTERICTWGNSTHIIPISVYNSSGYRNGIVWSEHGSFVLSISKVSGEFAYI